MMPAPTGLRLTHIVNLREDGRQNPLSGAEHHIFTLTRELAHRGADVELILVLSGEPGAVLTQTIEAARQAGVRIEILPVASDFEAAPRRRFASVLVRLFPLLRARRTRIIHVHLELAYTPLLAWLAGARRICISVHNDEPFYGRRLWQLRWRLWRRLGFSAIAITHHVARYVGRLAGDPAWPHTVYYGVPLPVPESVTREEHGLPADQFIVGFVGRLAEQKNLPALIRASAAAGVKLVLIGDGPMRAELEMLARELEADVQFWGARPGAARLMPLFNLLILPSSWEGLGLVLIEAMLRRVPVAGSSRGAIPEILGGGRYGTVFEPTAEGIAQALRVLKGAKVLRLSAESAYIYAESTFTVEQMLRRTAAVYQLI